jgi:hypothetical protein
MFTKDILFGMNILSLAGFAVMGLSLTLCRMAQAVVPLGDACRHSIPAEHRAYHWGEVCPARLAPAMISTLGHRVPRRRQRGAPPALAPFGPDRP